VFCESKGLNAFELILSIPEARYSLRFLGIGRLPSRRSPPCAGRHLRISIAISRCRIEADDENIANSRGNPLIWQEGEFLNGQGGWKWQESNGLGNSLGNQLGNQPFTLALPVQELPFLPNEGISSGIGDVFVDYSTADGTVDFAHFELDIDINSNKLYSCEDSLISNSNPYNFGFSNSSFDISLPFGAITMNSQIDDSFFSFDVTPQLISAASGGVTPVDISKAGENSTTGDISRQASSPSSEAESASSSPNTSNPPTISCSWPSCSKSFLSRRDYKLVLLYSFINI
jgi:hypothetical protein